MRIQAESPDAVEMNLLYLDGPALQSILQHCCSQRADVANLLLTSKSMYSAVFASCKGQMQVAYKMAPTSTTNTAQLQDFMAWLAIHGQLVGFLSIDLRTGCPASKRISAAEELEMAAVEQALAASLLQASGSSNTALSGTSGTGLQLHTCELDNAGVHAAAVLQQLPGCSLTELYLGVRLPGSNGKFKTLSDQVMCLTSSLSHLTNLRSLGLEVAFKANSCLQPLANGIPMGTPQPLSGLTNAIPLGRMMVNSALQLLPTSLKNFTFSWEGPCHGDGCQLHLSHLTALTQLIWCSGLPMECTLPPSLVELHVTDLMDSACLMPLKDFQSLHLTQIHGADANLQHLGALTSLTQFEVSFNSVQDLDLSSWSWKTIPLRYLLIQGRISEHTVHHLGRLTQLTSLALRHCCVDCSPATFAAVLQKMTQLKSLGLVHALIGVYRQQQFEDEDTWPGPWAMHIFGAIAGLHGLRSLYLAGLPIGPEAAIQSALASTTWQLTRLYMNACNLGNSSLSAVVVKSPHLEALSVIGNPQLNDEVLPQLADSLSGLRAFFCKRTSITESGCLTHLPHVHCISGQGN